MHPAQTSFPGQLEGQGSILLENGSRGTGVCFSVLARFLEPGSWRKGPSRFPQARAGIGFRTSERRAPHAPEVQDGILVRQFAHDP